MSMCIYDNPATFRREAWENGVMVGFIALSLLETKGFDIHDLSGKIPWYLHDGKWVSGRITGDPEAMMKGQTE